MLKRLFISQFKFPGRRRTLFYLPLFIWAIASLAMCCWLVEIGIHALLPPPPPDQDLQHLRRSRSLKHYLDNTQLLIEPSSDPCGLEETPVIILVTSAPTRYEARDAIRDTWARHQPTFFVMGVQRQNVDEQLVNNYVEAKQYSDLLVFDFYDHYQNLTLKTALMLKWTLKRCPQAQFMFKADDDVLVNPWTLRQVLKDNRDAKLLGPGYIISGEYIENILNTAFKIPILNIEDVYFTYIVARRTLGLSLTHERRLSPHKPWIGLSCAYWDLASAHSLSPKEMLSKWGTDLELH
ncbi:hypothetical protein K1T71_012803 [Dendrolimus kikuchii]|uniref:Uncharacterized protein n=1 Tax=Dendrolimus kikuchii TaxID=765133 RepID=A0ACC1CI97_9NEOP|nr:hypothetical protein K1T71_012803 [Dendrolimus kikuchii]